MILPDANVLLYAFRKDSTDHSAYFKWLDGIVNGISTYAMSPQVLSSVIRIATHSKIYNKPSRLAEALAFCNVLISQPQCVIVLPGTRHWSIFDQICRKSSVSGNLVQDAWLAALAIESGCEWITTDRDFARFPGLRWRTPF